MSSSEDRQVRNLLNLMLDEDKFSSFLMLPSAEELTSIMETIDVVYKFRVDNYISFAYWTDDVKINLIIKKPPNVNYCVFKKWCDSLESSHKDENFESNRNLSSISVKDFEKIWKEKGFHNRHVEFEHSVKDFIAKNICL